jgi:hypothetical protein
LKPHPTTTIIWHKLSIKGGEADLLTKVSTRIQIIVSHTTAKVQFMWAIQNTMEAAALFRIASSATVIKISSQFALMSLALKILTAGLQSAMIISLGKAYQR